MSTDFKLFLEQGPVSSLKHHESPDNKMVAIRGEGGYQTGRRYGMSMVDSDWTCSGRHCVASEVRSSAPYPPGAINHYHLIEKNY